MAADWMPETRAKAQLSEAEIAFAKKAIEQAGEIFQCLLEKGFFAYARKIKIDTASIQGKTRAIGAGIQMTGPWEGEPFNRQWMTFALMGESEGDRESARFSKARWLLRMGREESALDMVLGELVREVAAMDRANARKEKVSWMGPGVEAAIEKRALAGALGKIKPEGKKIGRRL